MHTHAHWGAKLCNGEQKDTEISQGSIRDLRKRRLTLACALLGTVSTKVARAAAEVGRTRCLSSSQS